ncbi:hypothetical protein [Parasitella parasitica]|uniref:LIM zinc-binding domain-containing protein n=1 Tax=Parasitella parasitica TaxID=35722 RepID=A0A0B7NCV8_9FUNG|nr:hypothetical protein [Parasitella parasitica]
MTPASSSLLAKAAVFSSQARLGQTSTDKWQDTYGKKAIFNGSNSGSVSTPIQRRPQRTMPQFDMQQPKELKACAKCHRKQNSWTDLNSFTIHNSAYYCKTCLTETVDCPGCSKPLERTTTQTVFNNQAWHSSCFQCGQCQSPLKPMLASMDSEGRPSCRTCQLKDRMQAMQQSPKPSAPSTSTPALSSLISPSRSTSTTPTRAENPYLRYQQSRRASMFNPASALIEDRIKARSVSPTSPSLSTSSYISIDSSVSTPHPAIEPKKTESSRRRKLVKKPCKECGQHVSKKDYRGLRIPSGELLCFHSYCLFCARCQQTFNGLEFCTDGTKFYHTECPATPDVACSSPPLSAVGGGSRQGTPSQSEEDETYPRTPPQADNFFNVATTPSPTESSFPPSNEELQKQQQKQQQESETVMCNACAKPVTDTCLELSNNFYHKECLLCAGCNKTVPTDRKLAKYQDKLYCDQCTPSSNKAKRIVRSVLKINTESAPPTSKETSRRHSTVTTPSEIFRSRKSALPQLGGERFCAHCKKSMPLFDALPGPNASRWHKKCLRCAGCKKQMDSDAHMTVKDDGVFVVHCRGCLDDTPKPRFVRR